MDNFLRIILIVLGSLFTLTVIYLLIKKKISEKQSLLWLMASIAALVLSIEPLTLDKIAQKFGIHYPPGLLFLITSLILLLITLYHSIQISGLNTQVKELTQRMAVQDFLDNKEKQDLINSKKIKDSGDRVNRRIENDG